MSKSCITAGSLARILASDDPKRIVVLATRDERGELVWLPVRSVSTVAYDPKRHEVGIEELTDQAIRLGFTQEDVLVKAKPAVVLSP